MRQIPMYAAYRGIVYAMVDDEDFYMLCGYAWHLHGNGKGTSFYVATGVRYYGIDGIVKKVDVLMHHAILGLPPIGYDIHHISGDVLDNRRCNLQIISSLKHSSISGLTRTRHENRGYVKDQS